MAGTGNYSMPWGPNAVVGGTNPTGSHYSGGFGSNDGIVRGCGGPVGGSQSVAGNPGYQYQRGGGYGFAEQQSVVGNNTMGIDKYSNIGVNNPGMLNSSMQYNPSEYPLKSIPIIGGRKRRRRNFKRGGGGVNYYYGYAPGGEGSMSVFSGSGYHEISKGSQCAGGRKGRKSRKNKKHNKSNKYSHHSTRKMRKFNCMKCGAHFNTKNNLRKHLQRCSGMKSNTRHRMRSDLFRKLRGGTTRRQRGGYSQYLSNQPFSLTYSAGGQYLSPNMSALANPVPITPMNNCTDPNGPPRMV